MLLPIRDKRLNNHGARCTCALKKEHLDPVPEVDITDTPQPRSTLDFRRPQLTTTPSENSLIVFSNGHHKPAHKHNDAARKCGAPYSIPRPHSIHGHSDIAQKSMDHLPLVRNTEEARSQFQESISSAQQEVRLVRSEHNSPQSRAVLTVDELNRHIPPLDLSFPTYDDNPSSPFGDDYTYQPANVLETYFPTSEEQPVLSAGLNMPAVNWTAFDLPLDNNAFSSTCSQPPSYASFEYSNIGQPGLTTSSSGEVSEAEDYMPHGGPSPPIPGPNHIVSNSPDAAESEIYRLSSASSYLSLPQASLLAASNIDKLDIDAFLHATATCPGDFEVHNLATTADADRFSRHGFTVRDAQKLAHPCVPTEAMGDLSLPTPNDNINPPWASSFNGEDPSLDPELDIPDSPWAS
ncbi:hypothetical protein MMC12_001015 [Toensbergia leucococca]|nr:hypothetical protein [Toensbergia leucococca]